MALAEATVVDVGASIVGDLQKNGFHGASKVDGEGGPQ